MKLIDAKILKVQFPVQLAAGSAEKNKSAWNKYNREISYIYRLCKITLEKLYELASGIVDGTLAVDHTKGSLTIQMNAKDEEPFNGAKDRVVNITALKIGTFDTDKLLFPNGDTMNASTGNR